MWRVVDTTLTAHCLLRDRYRRRELLLTLLVLALSIVATAAGLLSDKVRVDIGPASARLATWLGILTAVIFFLALVDLVFDWRRRAWAHEDAARRIGDLKLRMRAITLSNDMVDAGATDIRAEYEQTLASVVEIPERQFLAMKSKHHRKVVLSKLIDTHAGAPVPYLRLLAAWRGIRGRNRPAQSDTVEEPPA